MKIIILIISIIFSTSTYSKGLDVFSLGVYDVKFDGSQGDIVNDYRYERRFDNTVFNIGPEEDNFFFLKPFVGIESTSDSAYYFISGIYIEEKLEQLAGYKNNNLFFTPSFGVGYYDDGNGKDL